MIVYCYGHTLNSHSDGEATVSEHLEDTSQPPPSYASGRVSIRLVTSYQGSLLLPEVNAQIAGAFLCVYFQWEPGDKAIQLVQGVCM